MSDAAAPTPTAFVPCTIDTCPLSEAPIAYLPTVPGNAVYLAIFAILLLAQAFLGVRHKTWGFMVGMIGGNFLEVLGYAARIVLSDNPFNFDMFLM